MSSATQRGLKIMADTSNFLGKHQEPERKKGRKFMVNLTGSENTKYYSLDLSTYWRKRVLGNEVGIPADTRIFHERKPKK